MNASRVFAVLTTAVLIACLASVAFAAQAPPKAEPFGEPVQAPQSVSPPAQDTPSRAAAAIINVPADFATIQAAIDTALSGDIINVAAGSYAEAILIDAKNLTIQGAGVGSSIITGTAGQTQYIVRITNGAVVDFSGFTVDGTGIDREYGIYADAGSDGDIHDNEVKNVSWPGAGGIAIRRQECYIDVTNNDVYGFGRIGIYTRDDVIGNTDTGVISGNTVTGLGGSDPDRLSYGISVYSGNPTVDGNDIYDCVSGVNVAIWASACMDIWTGSTSTVSNNNMYDSDYGIISNSASPTMTGNTFTNIANDNVRLDYFVKGNPTPHWAEYYDTIQDAIDAIPVTTYPTIVWIGIYSGGGTYSEAVNVNKACAMYGDSRATVTIDPVGLAVNNAGVYVATDNVELYSFTLVGDTGNSLPRYGVKFGEFTNCVLEDVEVRTCYRTGVDVIGTDGLAVTNVDSHDNGGNGLQCTDARNVTFTDITTANNAWGGVGIFTYGRYTPLGTWGIVFTGTNSFGEPGALYLEEGNYNNPASPEPISYSENIVDGADVTVQLADFTHVMEGNSDNANNYKIFFDTLANAQAVASVLFGHLTDGRYIIDLGGPNVYVPNTLGGLAEGIAAADPGDTVHVDAGTFDTAAQVLIDKNLTVSGAGSGATTVTTSFSTGSSGDSRAWFLVDTGADFDLEGLTLDGSGQLVYQAIRNKGLGSCDDVVFTEIKFNESGPTYSGVAIAAFGTGPVDVTNCHFSEIGRIGVLYFGSVVNTSYFTDNTYVGKGVGDWLDYACDISNGAHVVVSGNHVSGNRGVASSDGSTSAAFLITTFFGPGTTAEFTGNTMTDNTTGLAVGYDGSDTSTVEAHWNVIAGNDYGVVSTGPTVDAINNWWGDATGPLDNSDDTGSGGLYNPGGLGDEVTDNVLYDPWLSGSSVVSVSPAYGVTTCGSTIVYDVRLDHAGVPDEVRGVDVDIAIPTAIASAGTGDFVEGPLLGTVGEPTYFAVLDQGGGVFRVNTAILGGSTGATDDGVLFSVTLTATTEGTGDILLSSLQVRDPNNVPLSAGVADGELQVDCTVPTMEWPLDEPENVCYNTAPTFANFGFDDDVNLDLAEYQIDSDGWNTIFTGIDATEYNDDGYALPGFAGLSEGAHTVYFRVKDDAGNYNGEGTPDTYSWAFIKDTTAPDAPTDFAALPGHDKTHLSWTNPVGDPSFVGIEIRAVGWGDYPEYGTPGPAAPSYPANETEGFLVAQVTGGGTTYDDNPRTPRDIYYYSVFAYDCAGNYSALGTTAKDRTTSYWLGDIYPAGSWDGNVDIDDLAPFSAAFGESDGDAGWNNEVDFGPTDDFSRFGIPLPDNIIQFEDLMIFAMNYGNVGPAGVSPAIAESDATLADQVTVRLELRARDGNTATYAVILENGAEVLKGVSVTLDLGIGGEMTAVRAAGIANNSGVFMGTVERDGEVDVCAAALGVNRPLQGSGAIAEIDVSSDLDAPVRIARAELRDVNNERDEIVTSQPPTSYMPAVNAVFQNVPNPFNPMTSVQFDVARAGVVTIRIYDVTGRLVRTLLDSHKEQGRYTVEWDGTDNRGTGVHSGVYFYRMTAPGYQSPTKKMLLLK